MARSFAGIPTFAYIGTPFSIAIPEGGTAARWVPFYIDWSLYNASTANPNIVVEINLQTTQAGVALRNIRAVRIDNTGNPVPVYVYFADTRYIVVAPPNTIVQENVITAVKSCQVIGEGFTTGQIGATNVYFSNVPLPAVFDPEVSQAISLFKASANITHGQNVNNTNFGVPGLCDQSTQSFSGPPLNNNQVTANINWRIASGFAYVNALQMTMIIGTGVAGSAQISLRNALGAAEQWTWPFMTNNAGHILFPVVTGLNLKLDLSVNWQLHYSGANLADGEMLCEIGFTTNPT